VRFNDFLFAAHGAVMCVVIYTQFFPWIWGFKVGSRQKASRVVLGIFWGCILGILLTTVLVRTRGRNGGYDPSGWAWLDVVSAVKIMAADVEG
jgi:cystinosin